MDVLSSTLEDNIAFSQDQVQAVRSITFVQAYVQ